jgi:hypothetical protein
VSLNPELAAESTNSAPLFSASNFSIPVHRALRAPPIEPSFRAIDVLVAELSRRASPGALPVVACRLASWASFGGRRSPAGPYGLEKSVKLLILVAKLTEYTNTSA